ncbi:MFS transporter [Weissella diestrammenae]|uniref:MFS transporter n=1 Tax=Weissella diestrammenae TaxID=1162633 RepID=A0A7G9T4T6_9LACO|nr:MFS transporter [Weissella diestrammenae]MCM0582823.1 MFS transporter [Weissella diestrammenae]QNN75111.1 MFS transporter [Weissella diestrammenae]
MLKKLEQFPIWQRNMYVLWVGVFLTGAGLSMVNPFLSLYIDTLGNFTKSELSLYSGATFAISFLMMAIVSPLWGKLADLKGRKKMILRAGIGMSIVFIGMSAVSNVWELMLLRALQGAFGGFISNSNALIASETPLERSGYAMGVMMTGSTAGTLLGPLFGGMMADAFGYRYSFMLTGGLILLSTILVLLLVKEVFVPVKRGETLSRQAVFKTLKYPGVMKGLFFTTMMIMTVNQSINPILALFVRELNHHGSNTALLAGIVAATPGVAALIAAPRLGRLGDKLGTSKVMMFGFGLAFIVFLPMGWVSAVWQLAALRFFIGISDSTMMPALQTLITKTAPHEVVSRMFAYNQSYQAMGSVIGPIIGAVATSFFDYRGVFIISGLIIGINGIWFRYNTRQLREDGIA